MGREMGMGKKCAGDNLVASDSVAGNLIVDNLIVGNLIAWYPFDDAADVGKDASGNGKKAVAKGERKPVVKEVCGRKAAVFEGGSYGASYLQLPADLLNGVGDENGLTVSTWVCGSKASNVWERLFDFGKGQTGPYLFLTRFLRGVCFKHTDLAADAGKAIAEHEWMHIVMTVTGTKGGTLSSAGPRVYINGELAADGFISQTSSGTYKMFREWLSTLEEGENYSQNFIGHSQFGADADFCGALSDFRVYKGALSSEEILHLMCEALSDEEILKLAQDKFLPAPAKIITKKQNLPTEIMDGRVKVTWSSDRHEIFGADGSVHPGREAIGITIQAVLTGAEEKKSGKTLTKTFPATVLPESIAPYELTVHGTEEVLDISPTLFGLFYEDINNAADGGIYAEMVNNRSFEAFTYDTYDARSGENGISTGRNHTPLRFWFGDTDKVTVKNKGGLNEYFGLKDKDTNAYYIEMPSGTKLYNRGFCDNNEQFSMNLKAGESYDFSLWAKPKKGALVKVSLQDEKGRNVGNELVLPLKKEGKWAKYKGKLTAEKSVWGQLAIEAEGTFSLDMVSLMPCNVWGAKKEKTSKSAHKNFKGNSNYRLRRDLMETLVELHPRFLRFPGGCISEGSYIWENVYDWKESVGAVEVRKENFNVWGYMMTMGLGYMEYFQLAEDLQAEPLPVMACGVLCQARSDYANPAGGDLRRKYIKNFTDLIDFAISTDFENNEWACLRRKMGHEEPFGLHYLGVGNENWGTEFFANFEVFKHAIDRYMKKNYPAHELHIISTAGAQADDDAYKQGWKFLAGCLKGGAKVAFTDGRKSFTEEVTWYKHKKHYLDTIVDEHYYRSNDYLLENADRYNYYVRAYKKGVLDEGKTSKVFVGEYASGEKNTLAGAVAEAAVMTGFERNSDVVRLAATAPLFNKVVTDGTYRWTPDAIWFDNEAVWRTPNYYVQQLFAKYIGTKLLDTTYVNFKNGERQILSPKGGVLVSVTGGKALLQSMRVRSNRTKEVLFEQDFAKELKPQLMAFGTAGEKQKDGIAIDAARDGKAGFTIAGEEWSDYTVEVTAKKLDDSAVISVGAGLDAEAQNLLEYCVGDAMHGTGLKVYKDGKEGYTMGDYSSSVYAGNLRACYDEAVETGVPVSVTVNYGGKDKKSLLCFYQENGGEKKGLLEYKLEAYNREVFHSVTTDEEKVYIKLVNAEDFTKKLKVSLDALCVDEKAETLVLTGEEELAHTPLVNTKEEEKIVPVKKTLRVKGDSFTLELPAQSLTVVVLRKR